MVNFGQLMAQEDQPLVTDPRQLFQTLRRDEGYEYLRDVQGDVLDAWYARRDDQDLIIKMNTGSGKTLVGLMLLWSKLKEGKGPALYLCPNNHLVDQVKREADALSIRHVDFEGPSDNLFPSEFFDGSAIIITNIHKLFNGRSLFHIAGVPDPISVGTILIDDAHTCINIAREQCTARFNVTSELGQQLVSMFETALNDQSVAMLADIHQHKRNSYLRVPYWSWQERISDVARLFSEHGEGSELRFVWPLFRSRQVLMNSTVVISGNAVEISPYLLPISLFPSFSNAQHRIYMSATLVEDSALVRDFGANPESVPVPIMPKTRGDIGERLIITPALVDTRIEDITATKLASEIQSMHGVNAIVLVPSAQRGKIWEAEGFGAISREEISDEIQNLIDTQGNRVVIANRYDGIDLPDDACRLLVLDGLPDEHRLANLIEATARQDSPILKKQKAQRVEQGIGRGVRSHTDYCVVILTGNSLLRFMSQVDNQQFFTEDTKRQVEIGKELCQMLRQQDGKGYDAIIKLASQCLERDPDWQTYHRTRLQSPSQSQYIDIDEEAVSLASAEIGAWNSALSGQYQNAATTIAKGIDSVKNISDADKGWFLQLEASYLHQIDRVDAAQKQLKAHEWNPHVLKPMDGVSYRRIQARQTVQAYAVLQWVQRVTEPNALVCEAEDVLAHLEFGIDHKVFEAAFKDLAMILGFNGQRPEDETNQGPDVLWCMNNDRYLVVEAKQEVSSGRSLIYKNEAAQLGHSATWFEQHYPGKAYTPVLVHPSRTLAPDAYLTEDARVIQPDSLGDLVQRVGEFIGALATKPPTQWTVTEIADQLSAYQLRPQDLLQVYFGKTAVH